MYSADQGLSSVSCSDGSNGLITRLGVWDMSSLYPYVAAFDHISWNSENCGKCAKVTNKANGKSTYVTLIDGCGSIAGYPNHFDMAPPAFNAIDDGAGVASGHMIATYEFVSTSNCKGNNLRR